MWLTSRYFHGPCNRVSHDDVIKWKHFLRSWSFARRIHRSSVDSPHKGQWCRALMFSLICAWINDWANNRDAGGLKGHRTHCDATIMHMATIQFPRIFPRFNGDDFSLLCFTYSHCLLILLWIASHWVHWRTVWISKKICLEWTLLQQECLFVMNTRRFYMWTFEQLLCLKFRQVCFRLNCEIAGLMHRSYVSFALSHENVMLKLGNKHACIRSYPSTTPSYRHLWGIFTYHKVSNISRTKSQNLIASRVIL